MPCGWCGSPVEQPPAGRLRRYCNRSCRQRAYETRTAGRRLGADVDAGVVRTEPAERIVERVVRARYPRTAAGWETALTELSAQVADGRLPHWHAERVHRALSGAAEQTRVTIAEWTPPPAPPPVDERLAAAAEALLRVVGDEPTTLERLAAALRLDVVELRQVVLELEHIGLLAARREKNVVSVDELRIHARFTLGQN
ncbi:hypothetical protein SAMN05421748_14454 [Paractinoplanes atraurantiacus]|uniref:Uncharacterized protein n=2 Tax=Paractinoplanes atraurantiacus TaxID=1036182 RepID=A0A285KNP6_9ACTN|nr:hypothetical protein SAMN05421748_14454 [Actinoplanes atraurantiacus]